MSKDSVGLGEFITFTCNPNVFYKMCSLLDSPDYKLNSSSDYFYICALKKIRQSFIRISVYCFCQVVSISTKSLLRLIIDN